MSLPDWVTTDAWEVLRLGGLRIPGVAKVTGELGSGLDVKKPKGGKKATIKDDGDPPGELDVELTMTHADVVAFMEIVPILRAVTKGGARDPLKCEHPEAYLWGINNVTVGTIRSEPPAPGGRKRFSFKLIEWAPAPAAVKASKKTPEGDSDAADWSRFSKREKPIIATTPFVQRKPSSEAGDKL